MTLGLSNKEKGFTLVEVVVVLPMMLITLAAIGALLMNVYVSLSEKTGRLEMELEGQSTLFAMRDDLFYATRFAGTNQSDTTDAFEPTGGWNAIRDKALIVYEASYTKNRQSVDRKLIRKDNSPKPCSSIDVDQNNYSINTIIYFQQGSNLYRRVLIPDQANNCDITYRQQTCPAANVPTSCSVADTLIAQNVKTYDITYYEKSSTDKVISSSTLESDPNRFIRVARAEINLTLEKLINAEPVQTKAKINIKKIE